MEKISKKIEIHFQEPRNMRRNFSSLTSRTDILCWWAYMQSENTWMADYLIVEMSTPMTMTMNIHLTMTMNILFTIMWMQTTTEEVGHHPAESASPPSLRCSSDVSPPRPGLASL